MGPQGWPCVTVIYRMVKTASGQISACTQIGENEPRMVYDSVVENTEQLVGGRELGDQRR